MKNRFITFEGVDGSGKSTQMEFLNKKLLKLNIPFISLRDPGSNKLSESIREILLDKNNIELSNISESFLFLAARAQLVEKEILPALAMKKFVLCDRFTDSTLAYQGYGRGLSINLLKILNNFATQDIKPSLTFIIDIDEETIFERLNDHSHDRMESTGIEFYKKIREGYYQLSKENKKRYFIIDGNRSKIEIFDDIWKIVIDRYRIMENNE